MVIEVPLEKPDKEDRPREGDSWVYDPDFGWYRS